MLKDEIGVSLELKKSADVIVSDSVVAHNDRDSNLVSSSKNLGMLYKMTNTATGIRNIQALGLYLKINRDRFIFGRLGRGKFTWIASTKQQSKCKLFNQAGCSLGRVGLGVVYFDQQKGSFSPKSLIQKVQNVFPLF